MSSLFPVFPVIRESVHFAKCPRNIVRRYSDSMPEKSSTFPSKKFSRSTSHAIIRSIARRSASTSSNWHQKLAFDRRETDRDDGVIHSRPRPLVRPRRVNFSVMTYNILAQANLERHRRLYVQSPVDALEWECRKVRIRNAIIFSGADIVCLQEVETDCFNDFLKPTMESRGFAGFYMQKSELRREGCAVFVNKNVFEVEDVELVHFNKGVGILDRDNVAIFVMLNPRCADLEGSEGFGRICVATTHLVFSHKHGDVKLAQLALMMKKLDAFLPRNARVPTILCGDLNLEPNSPLYRFATSGSLDYRRWKPEELAKTISSDDVFDDEPIPVDDVLESLQSGEEAPTKGNLRHSFKFVSSYGERESGITTYHEGAKSCVDYLFYDAGQRKSHAGLVLTGSQPVPDEDRLEDIGKIPNHFQGSDHFPLHSSFSLTF